MAAMPHWMTVKNLTLFAEEVIPRLRKFSPLAAAPGARAAEAPATAAAAAKGAGQR
jgi:hypothetical protein